MWNWKLQKESYYKLLYFIIKVQTMLLLFKMGRWLSVIPDHHIVRRRRPKDRSKAIVLIVGVTKLDLLVTELLILNGMNT